MRYEPTNKPSRDKKHVPLRLVHGKRQAIQGRMIESLLCKNFLTQTWKLEMDVTEKESNLLG